MDSLSLLKRFNTMVTNVLDMVQRNGPIYSVWIKFQIGNKEPITFKSNTQNKQENVIASLRIEKGTSAHANDFTLVVQYDPFDNGQDSKGIIDRLDDYIASAIQPEWNMNTDSFIGKISYGYNSPDCDDSKLCSMEYNCQITDMKNTVNFDSGLSTYTFSGVSYIGVDCDYEAEFTAVSQWNPIDLVVWILYYHYGDPNNIPYGIRGEDKPCSSALGYKIDVSQEILNDQQAEKIDVEAASGMSPWQYCLNILDKYRLSQTEIDSGRYNELDKMNPNQIPGYTLYITDFDKTIHLEHYSPETSKNMSVDHVFTWSDRNKSLVTRWSPDVDLRQYLIQKLQYERAKDRLEKGGRTTETVKQDKYTQEQYDDDNQRVAGSILEKYNAELEIVGIPSDPPITAEVTVIPKILESTSRTAGIYTILGCDDVISTNGTYITTLKLYRVRGINQECFDLESLATANKQAQETVKQNETSNTTNNSNVGNGGGRWRRK